MKWGFIGTGRIAERIMEAFELLPDSQVVAAYSRNHLAIKAFCDRWDIAGGYDTIEELCHDPEVEIVYLATPHIVHLEHFEKAVNGGKPVLCEKPMGMSAEETRRMADLAREKGIFLMEGLWTRFFPIYQWLEELIDSGSLGRLYNVMADFSYHSPYDPGQRFFRKDLGGGAMRGAGIYPLSLAVSAFGAMPCEVQAMADMKNDVDLRGAALLRFPGGGMAQIVTGFQGESAQGANLAFEKGSVWIPDFWHPTKAVLKTGGQEQVISRPFDFPGFQFEIMEVEHCVREGQKESRKITLDESVGLAEILDGIYRRFYIDFGGKGAEKEK